MHENTESRRVASTPEVSKNFGMPPSRTRPRYIVVPAGIGFFHITEFATGQVKGFRCHHGEACNLAKVLETGLPTQPA